MSPYDTCWQRQYFFPSSSSSSSDPPEPAEADPRSGISSSPSALGWLRRCLCVWGRGTGVPLPARDPARDDRTDSASESSLSAVDAGDPFDTPARLTRDNVDFEFGGFLRLTPAVGVPLLPAPTLPALDVARGPALPALTVAPGVPALGVPGPREECRASPLDAVGRLPRPELTRGPLFGTPLPGPAEDSRWLRLLMIILAAGDVGAELEICVCDCVVRI